MTEAAVTFRGIRRVLWITMGLNLIPSVAKLLIGYWTGSLSLIADGFDSVFDAASNVVGLVGIHIAARPADEEHPYGHRKAETFAALVIAGLLFLTTWELGKSAVERLLDPARIRAEVNAWSFGALLLSMLIHGIVVWYEMREGRRLRSEVLVADARHTRADILVSLAVMGGLVAVRLGYPLADPILALVVAGFIARIGVEIVRDSMPALLDRTVVERDEIEQVALAVPGVESCHRIRSRGHNQAIYADLHIRVAPEMSTSQAHAVAHEVQRRLRARRPDIQDVTVHVEPSSTPEEGQRLHPIATRLRRIADGLGISVHGINAYEVGKDTLVEAHLEADNSVSLAEAHRLASELEERARREIPGLTEITTHIEPQGTIVQNGPAAQGESEVEARVQEILRSSGLPGSYHQLQVRRGSCGWVVSLHYQLPGQMALVDAHELCGSLEQRLRERVPNVERVLIHTEPDGEM